MSVAAVGPEAAGRLARLHAQAFAAPWSEADLHALMGGAGALALAAEGGFILIRTLGPEAEILTLAVAPEARRTGLGRALVRAGAQAAALAGAETLFLEVASDNLAARRLYETAGFAPLGVRRGYYVRSDGSAADALTLRLSLNSSPSNL